MPRPLVAGLDSSTQSAKIVVCDAETGDVVRQARAAHPDGTEVSALHWWRAWEQVSADGMLDGVLALSVGGQQHGMVTLDGDDQLVRDALLWNDTRSADAARDLVQELGGPQAWVDRVDVVPLAAFTVAKLRWLADHEPDNVARTERVLLPHDWLTGRILQSDGGFERWTTDRGDASGTGYWSPVSEKYDEDLVYRACGRQVQLPHVLAPNGVAGRTTAGILVAPGTGDNMAAALSLGLQPGEAVVSLGTSGTVYAAHDRPSGDASGAVAGFADAAGGHLPLMCTLNAARVLSAGAAMLGTDLAGLDRLALAADAGAGGLVLLPYLDGERTPNLPGATGTIGGLTRANATPENLARACVEGMLANLAAGIADLRAVGVRVDRALLIGGAAASAAVRAIAPMVLGVPVGIPEGAEYVALGAARQAAWVLSGEGSQLPPWSVGREAVIDAPAGGQGEQIRGRYDELRTALHG
ncbi:MAG: FGGY family carbohydrate kinase [Actinomycetota bacterium]|nr:FGGY family carbohydrate kinase [Actinomycetota bacterium]